MAGEQQTESDIRLLLQNLFGMDELSIVSVEESTRLYSTIWLVTTDRNGVQERYIAKHVGSNAERQCQLAQRAEQIFSKDTRYLSLDTKSDIAQGIIVSRYSDLPRLEDTLSEDEWLRPIHWYREVERRVRLAGNWLNKYHSFESKTAPLSPAFLEFLGNREDTLEQLPPSTRDRLISAVTASPATELTITHGDFAPQNILTDGENLSVIDYGLTEWTYMSPYWDIVTFIIDLAIHARFRRRSLLCWVPGLKERMISSFLAGYGLSQVPDDREWHICVSVRYLALYRGSIKSTQRGKAAWYLKNLERHLDQFS